MAGQRGRDVLIKLSEDGVAENDITLAGIRASEIELNAEGVDGTAMDSPEAWRELVPGAGIKTARISGRGVFKDAESDHRMRQLFFAGAIVSWRLIIPGMGALIGPLHIKELKWGGTYDGEASFSVVLESAGVIAFEAEA